MKRLQLFILLLIISLGANAQTADTAKLIGIHTAVGKTITRDEKIKYQLFPEYNDREFDSAQIFRYNDTTYELRIASSNGSMIKTVISNSRMDDLYNRIDNIENGKTIEGDYVITAEEKKRQHDQRVKAERSEFWTSFLGDMVSATVEITMEVIFTLILN
ncbi:MAG: hypothetical protein JWP12_3254 [Bacteroidetes bacterium]|nr:hypothetical protein [Bacteroidota bacterium]